MLLTQAKASNVDDNLVVGIQLVKTTQIDPLNPLERDIMSVYDLVYESMVIIDDNYMPQPLLCCSPPVPAQPPALH